MRLTLLQPRADGICISDVGSARQCGRGRISGPYMNRKLCPRRNIPAPGKKVDT